MDSEHREQVDLARALAETLAGGDGRQRAAAVLDRFAECTRRHFSNEAALMRGAGYPGLAEHVREHTRYVSELERWSGAGRGAELTVGSAMALRDGIEEHIATLDREFARYVSSGAGGAA
jgi:hemerythrin-like metal-binding protein